MTRYAFIAAIAAVACTGDTGKNNGSGDTGTGPGGAPVVQSYTVTCAADSVTFHAKVSGEPFDGVIFEQETKSTYDPGSGIVQYSDEHDLGNAGDGIEGTIAAGAAYGTQTKNVSTLFTCDGAYNEPDWMTYAFGVYDDSAAIADCLIGGGDPDGLKAGDYDAFAVNASSFALSGCAVATSAR